ncbi:uncharacterized protein PSFLO_00683 [Pseudozyma flocculosa]|uniref:Uncharacterized protein n=1 Tax=Pseudozyma flocculosa TaxID=84751 RepID=A0A5C3ET40_9BASI|nr:uncharacterized protein PSFLO_00683 [Pseudozyma flocculosa]
MKANRVPRPREEAEAESDGGGDGGGGGEALRCWLADSFPEVSSHLSASSATTSTSIPASHCCRLPPTPPPTSCSVCTHARIGQSSPTFTASFPLVKASLALAPLVSAPEHPVSAIDLDASLDSSAPFHPVVETYPIDKLQQPYK